MPEIFLNGRKIQVVGDKLSYKQIVSLVKDPPRPQDTYTITFRGKMFKGELAPGETIDLEEGMAINAEITDKG